MKLSVYFTAQGLTQGDVAERPVLVIDVLRTTTTIVTALANGAKAVLPAETTADAIQLVNNLKRDDILLTGEQGYHLIEGFHCGNSPLEMTPEVVKDKTLVMATTNGSRALVAAQHGGPVFRCAHRRRQPASPTAHNNHIIRGSHQQTLLRVVPSRPVNMAVRYS